MISITIQWDISNSDGNIQEATIHATAENADDIQAFLDAYERLA